MKTLGDYFQHNIASTPVHILLQKFGMTLQVVDSDKKIPGSFWGEPEAGLIQNTLYASPKTPIHSILHEAGHYICMTSERRASLHTNALGKTKGNFLEENAVCFLQILLSDELEGIDRTNIFNDMDKWGYSFRLGSTQKWFESDSDDAREWLLENKLIDANNKYLFVHRL